MKKSMIFMLALTFLFLFTLQPYADANGQDKLVDLLKELDLLEKEVNTTIKEENFDIFSIDKEPQGLAVSHPCHYTSDHQNCDVNTLKKSCGCEVITNLCCCGKKMNTDYFLCRKHQFSYLSTEDLDKLNLSLEQSEGINKLNVDFQESIDTLTASADTARYEPHTCHNGGASDHKRCYKQSDDLKSCGCDIGFYYCCCGRVMGAYKTYCNNHGH